MRIFEIILIIVNFITLFMSFKKQPKAIKKGAMGVNLLAFLIHGVFEGFRYQMFFSYIFVIMFVIYTLIKIKFRVFEGKIPKLLKVIALSSFLILLITTSILSYAFPVFKLPKLTGSYDIGIKYFHLTDEKRKDPFLDKSNKNRELMVKVYYPAKEDATKPFSKYFNGDKKFMKAFTEFYNLPDFMFGHLGLVKANSKHDLQLSDKEQSYPVILFSHGGGTTMEVQTAQSEDLASHGYIVVAIDHTYISSATAFPNKIVFHGEATTEFDTVEPAEILTEIMADDSKFVMDKLGEINKGTMDSIFKGKLNLDKIGAIGHSLGGAVAYDLAINDRRIKASVDLDGRVFITPEENAKNVAPFLMIANDKYHVQAIQSKEGLLKKFEDMTADEQVNTMFMYGSKESYHEAYNKAKENNMGLVEVLKKSGNLYTIEGSDHMKFTDLGLFIGISQLRELIEISGSTNPVRCLEITEAVTAVFFDQHLKGEMQVQLESLTDKYPELKRAELY